MRIARSNYDKPFRCPIETGPALKAPTEKGWRICPGAEVTGGRWKPDVYDRGSRNWSIDKTVCCNTWVLPFNLRYLEPTWHYYHWKWRIQLWWRYSNLRFKLTGKRGY